MSLKQSPADIWNMLKRHVEDGEKAKEILARVWVDMGPYGHGNLEEETLRDMAKYFNFDDSE